MSQLIIWLVLEQSREHLTHLGNGRKGIPVLFQNPLGSSTGDMLQIVLLHFLKGHGCKAIDVHTSIGIWSFLAINGQ